MKHSRYSENQGDTSKLKFPQQAHGTHTLFPASLSGFTLLQMQCAAVKKSSGHVNKPVGRRNMNNSCNPNTSHGPSAAVSPSANCCVFPLVAPIRMIDETRCRGDG